MEKCSWQYADQEVLIYFTLAVVCLIVECTRRQRKDNSKKHSDSSRPAWLEMDRNVCPTTTISCTKRSRTIILLLTLLENFLLAIVTHSNYL